MRHKVVTFDYDDQRGIATCYIQYGEFAVVEQATCHPDDADFMSERTGCFIAECRANIRLLRIRRDVEVKPILKSLKHMLSCMERSSHYNPHSYEAKILRRQIRQNERAYAELNADIKAEREYLSDYLKNKDIMYQKMRKMASKDKND